MFTFPENDTAINMVVVDRNGSLGIFEFKKGVNDTLVIQFNIPGDSYRGVVALNPTNSSTRRGLSSTERPFGSYPMDRYGRSAVNPIVMIPTENSPMFPAEDSKPLRDAIVKHPHRVVRALQSGTAGSVRISVVECLQSAVPTSLSVVATSSGETVPVTVQTDSPGRYTAFFPVQKAEPISEAILTEVCDVISAVAKACPFILGKSFFVYSKISTIRNR